MNTQTYTLKELKERVDEGELDLSLSTLTEEDVPIKQIMQLKKFHSLDLSCNVLERLPVDLCTLVNLKKLDLSKNLIVFLPEEIGNLVNLQHLDLLGNKLTSLPEKFGKLSALRWLDLKDNPLSPDIKQEAGDCLDDKQCKSCAFKVVKMMAGIHKEREKKRSKTRAEQEVAAAKAEEEAKAAKKRAKMEEKERRRLQFLAQQKTAAEKVEDTNDEKDADASRRPQDEVDDGPADVSADATGVPDGISFIALFLLVLTGVVGVVFGLYFYCNSQKDSNPACNTGATVAIRHFVDETLLPWFSICTKKFNNFMESYK